MGITENMRFLFKGVTIDERTRNYIEKKLQTIDKFLENGQQVEVEIDLDKKGKFRVEIMVKTPRNLFRAENISESIEASTDLGVDQLQDQINHLKDRLRTLKKRGAMSIKKKTVLDENARF
jgi:ribosomal subunit interface protein